MVALAPYRLFEVVVRRTDRLSPSFLRVTLTGADLDAFADNGFDQRIKLVLPLPGVVGFGHLGGGGDWYQRWRALPDGRRNPIRTYTVRRVRRDAAEVDVDFALHDDGGGPASRWAAGAIAGDRVAIAGPDAGFPGDHGGRDFRAHAGVRQVLLAGDETAVPAIASILECLPAGARGHALLEVPHAVDALDLDHPPGVRVSWLGRDGGPHGCRVVPAVRDVAGRIAGAGEHLAGRRRDVIDDVDVDADLLWEVPDDVGADGLSAWLAGEAGVIKTLRRILVTDLGVDRRSVAFMGYWRLGRAEHTG